MFIDANRQYSKQNMTSSKKRRKAGGRLEELEEDIKSREKMTP